MKPSDPASSNVNTDHALGPADAEITLIEYGSYACERCHAVHEIVEGLRNRFGDRMRYVFRHLPIAGSRAAVQAAELAEYAAQTTGRFWEVHEALMERGPTFTKEDFAHIAREFNLPDEEQHKEARAAAKARLRNNVNEARQKNIVATPTFYINGSPYLGAWDESSLTDAMLGSLGHKIQSAAFNFVRWGPASGLLLGIATLLALVLSNSGAGAAFLSFWETRAGFQWGSFTFSLTLLDWINHGLLSVFFFVVGLEIKREFTVGHLSTIRSGALPVLAAFGGIILPALIYVFLAPPELRHGWGIPIGTDTAFAVAIIVLLGDRVPVELRVFLTAAVIIDDIVAILVIAIFYSGGLSTLYLVASALLMLMLVLFNRIGIYQMFPYVVCGVLLWFCLHEAGLHATLAGVVLAVLIPTLPPANLNALLAQASTVIHEEDEHAGEAMRSGPSEPTVRTLNTIFSRIESPADKLLRTAEPWSSYVVLPIFALANAGVVWSGDVFQDYAQLMAAIVLGLVAGKALGIISASWLAVRCGLAEKPGAYSWRQLIGAGALGGIGFTMSLFIAGLSFPEEANYAAAKISIFIASIIAAVLGVIILFPKRREKATSP